MRQYHAIRKLPNISQTENLNAGFKKGDVLVLFGELFQRGYANGLVEAAEKKGMKVIYTTVGRREKDNSLRPLSAEEISAQPQPFINIPLEAGFDLETDDQGMSPVDYLKEVKLSEWESFKMPAGSIEKSQKKGEQRFLSFVKKYMQELEQHIPNGANVLFAHLMAGGVPRAKVIMPIMNRVVKGTGERFLSSDKVVQSGVGELLLKSFYQVTAETFRHLISESSSLRDKIQKSGGQVSYLAYGYHGTEVYMKNQLQWQSYSPYIQGWAKMRLEDISQEFTRQGVSCCVYNCPEILTNSSSIFAGVELSLYPLLGTIQKLDHTSLIIQKCLNMLNENIGVEKIMDYTGEYLTCDLIRSHCVFEKWPQANSAEQLEKMLNASDELISFHKDPKHLITHVLSEVVFEGCGKVMLTDSFKPQSPFAWINHDIIAELAVQ